MTSSSKPEVVAWIWDYRGRHMATTDYSQALELSEPPYPTEVEPLVRLSDYERLQADHERLQAEYEELKHALSEARANDLSAMGYLSQIRAIVGGDDFPDMVRRCEKLRAELNLWSPIHDEVIRRAEKEHCLQDRCDFEVTVMYEDYAAMQETSHDD